MRRAIAAVVGLVVITGPKCSNSSTGTVAVASLEVVPDTINLVRGDSVRLTVSPLDASGHLISGIAITFASLDTSIITVSATGLVHAPGVGKTTVRVSGGGVSQSVPATVFALAARITVTPGDTTMSQGGTYALHATVFDNTDTPIPGARVAFASQDSTIAAVSSGGVVTGKKGGATTLLVTSGPAGTAATVTVIDSSIVSRTSLNGLPFGAAATKSGIAYVLRHGVNTASRFNLPSPAVALSFGVDNNPTVVSFDSAGATAYVTAQFADLVDVITVASNTVTDTIHVTGDAFVVRVSPDDKSIWVSTNVDSVYRIDRTTKAILSRYGFASPSNGIAFSPVNDSLMYVSTLGGAVVEINYKRSTLGRTFTPGGRTQAVAVAPNGAELYVANEFNNEIEIFDLSNGSQLTPIPTTGGAFDLTLSPNGGTIWVSESNVGVVQAFNRTSRQLQRTVNTGGAPRRIAVTPAATTVLVANELGWVDFIK